MSFSQNSYLYTFNQSAEQALDAIAQEPWYSEQDAKDEIKTNYPDDFTFVNRDLFWLPIIHLTAHESLSKDLKKTITTLEKVKKSQGLAIELGCGLSDAIPYLLQKGWRVIAVDKSPFVIRELVQKVNNLNETWLKTGQLRTCCQSMEDYEFPINVRLIIANKSLPFCQPARFKQLWHKIRAALELGGYFLGNVYDTNCPPQVARVTQRVGGAWLANPDVIKDLCSDRHYKLEEFGELPERIGLAFDLQRILSPYEALQVLYKFYVDHLAFFQHLNTPTEMALKEIAKEPWHSDEEAKQIIQKAFPNYPHGDRNEMWGNFAQMHSHFSYFPPADAVIDHFEKEKKSGGLAVDLGCGNSKTAIKLLEKGWTVVAVDRYSKSLDVFRATANRVDAAWLSTGQLKLVCQEMETFQFPKNVRLIVAAAALSYCQPAKFAQLWYNMEASLESGGRLIGNFIRPVPNVAGRDSMKKALGAWFINLEVAKDLLSDKHYILEFSKENDMDPMQPELDFVLKKV